MNEAQQLVALAGVMILMLFIQMELIDIKKLLEGTKDESFLVRRRDFNDNE